VDYDGDGFGDNSQGFQPDSCITMSGASFNDRFGCLDSDGDGWSNPDGSWGSIEGQWADALPFDSTEWLDYDNDGIGDNSDIDDDADGVADQYDEFPFDANEWEDNDADGTGNNEDLDDDNDLWLDVDEELCGTDSLDPSSTPIDTDLDLVCDTVDNNDDNDAYYDNAELVLGATHSDYCPLVHGNSTIVWYGCPDSDGDGLADFSDGFPYDPTKSWDRDNDGIAEEQEGFILENIHERYMPILVFGLFVVIALSLAIIFSASSRREN
jgi:hypothetical protein